jgi:hypothetical protein
LKWLCYGGAVGWSILGVGFWFAGMIPIVLARAYGPSAPTNEDVIGAWMRPMIVLAPIALLLGWSRTMRPGIYHRALEHEDKRPFVPLRVQIVAFPAIVFGSLILILFLGAVL